MNIKKAVYNDIINALENELSKNISEIRSNKHEMKKIVERQSKLKRSRKILRDLIFEIKGKTK